MSQETETSGADAEDPSLMMTTVQIFVGGLGMAQGVDLARGTGELPWWYNDILQGGLGLVRRGGDVTNMIDALRQNLQGCTDETFANQAERWMEGIVEDLREEGVLGWAPREGDNEPEQAELGDWACGAMDILSFEFQRQRGRNRRPRVTGTMGRSTSRSRTPTGRRQGPTDSGDTSGETNDVASFMDSGGRERGRDERCGTRKSDDKGSPEMADTEPYQIAG